MVILHPNIEAHDCGLSKTSRLDRCGDLHGLHLVGTVDGGNPVGSGGSKQLDIGLCIVEGILVIEDANLDDLHAREAVGFAEKGGAAFAAKVAIDCLAAVGGFLVDLWVAGDLEVIAGNNVVDTVGAATDLLTVGAVAQGLGLSVLDSALR